MTPEQILRDALRDAARSLGAPADFEPQLERPRDPSFGDWASNAAMLLARHLRRKPPEIAQELVSKLDVARAGVSEAYVAGAGFINFRLAAGAEARGLAGLLAEGARYGRSD
jgi:arginyl-tRNA synthetase